MMTSHQQSGVVMNTCNPRTQEAKADVSQLKASLDYIARLWRERESSMDFDI
jgi:hypothetical protein